MSSLFGSKDERIPPTRDDAEVQEARRRRARAAANQKGRSSTILTGAAGLTGDAGIARPTLLGRNAA